jgi:hypothetical protein
VPPGNDVRDLDFQVILDPEPIKVPNADAAAVETLVYTSHTDRDTVELRQVTLLFAQRGKSGYYVFVETTQDYAAAHPDLAAAIVRSFAFMPIAP